MLCATTGPPARLVNASRRRQCAWRGLEQAHVHTDPGEIGTRCEVHELQRIAAARLEVDRLPHAPRFAVALLALELEGVGGVVDADDELLARAEPRVLQLERKRSVAALVVAQLLAIEPRGGAPVRRAETRQTPADHAMSRAPSCRGRTIRCRRCRERRRGATSNAAVAHLNGRWHSGSTHRTAPNARSSCRFRGDRPSPAFPTAATSDGTPAT